MKNKEWEIYEADMVVRHVIPKDDTTSHTISTKCDCLPLVDSDDKYCIIIHHAFDGREKFERNENDIRDN